MPFKDPDEKRAYQRRWYATHSERVIASVTKRKHTLYAGVCVNCGGPTVGQSKNDRPDYCAKPLCARIQRIGKGEH